MVIKDTPRPGVQSLRAPHDRLHVSLGDHPGAPARSRGSAP